jgi:hypothetical protein
MLRNLPRTGKQRLKDHDLHERDALFVHGAEERGYGLLVTINLKDGEEADHVLSNLRKAVKRETGFHLEWRGVEVPALCVPRSLPPGLAGAEAPPPPFTRQRHLHAALDAQAGSPSHQAIEAFMRRRNKNMPRSMNIKVICRAEGGITSLISYFNGPKNGGDLIESRGTRTWMEELGRFDYSAMRRGAYWPGRAPSDPPVYVAPMAA